MLDSVLAQTLVEKIIRQLGHNINIMNDKGIIIASGDPKRIGDFHEVSYNIVQNALDFKAVRKNEHEYIGVQPGVNLPIVYNNKVIGVVGISGDPAEVTRFAHLVRMSVETLIEYEFYKEQIRKRQNDKNLFNNALLYEEPLNRIRLERLAADLKYDSTLMRIPILFELYAQEVTPLIIQSVKNSAYHTKQDISMQVGNNDILIFKTLPPQQAGAYKAETARCIDAVREQLPTSICGKWFAYVGTPQTALAEYRQAFLHVNWLKGHIRGNYGEFYYFLDHLSAYMQSAVAKPIRDNIFSFYLECIDKIGRDIFVETVTALFRSGMNISQAAKLLFVHRNTILFRLQKIKKHIGIDPVNSMNDHQLLLQLLHYIQAREKDPQM